MNARTGLWEVGCQKKTKEGGEGKRNPSASLQALAQIGKLARRLYPSAEYREKEASASYNFTFLKLQISVSLLRVGPYFRPSWYGIGYKMEVRNLSSSDLF